MSRLPIFEAKVSAFEGAGEVTGASSCTRYEKTALREYALARSERSSSKALIYLFIRLLKYMPHPDSTCTYCLRNSIAAVCNSFSSWSVGERPPVSASVCARGGVRGVSADTLDSEGRCVWS